MIQQLHRLRPFLEKIIGRKTALPILKHICIRGGVITATDLETTVRIKTDDERAYTIPLAVLTPVIKARPRTLTIQLKGGRVTIRYDKKQAAFKSLDPDAFPLTPAGRFTPLGVWSPPVLKELHRQLRFTSTDQLKPALTGVFVEQNGSLTSCASDGYILRRLKSASRNKLKNTFTGIVPSKSLRILTRLVQRPVRVAASDTHLKITVEPGLALFIRLIKDEYPDFERVIPKTFAGRVTFDKAGMTRLLRESRPFLNRETQVGHFTVTESGLTFRLVNEAEGLTWEAALPVLEKRGKDLQIGLNVSLLDTVLQPIDTPEVLWRYGSPTSAGVVTGLKGTESQALQLLMPVRTEDA